MSFEFSCADVGLACRTTAKAATADELVTAVAEHARTKHGVELNDTLIDYALTKVKTSGGAEGG